MANEPDPSGQTSDSELFRQALAEPPASTEPTEPQAPPPEVQTPPVEPPAPPPQVAEGIPSWRLREEAEARRVAEDRARQLEARLQQIETHMRQGQKQPDFFENPNGATQALIVEALRPFAEQFQQAREQDRRERIYMGKMIADSVHGADKVNEAEQAFLKAREDQTLDTMDYERVVQAPNRYDEVVRWHQRQNVLSSVGNDPAAWFEKQLEARMADPKFQAQLLGKIQGDAASRPAATNLPPSLSKATSAQNNREVVGDMSDRSLFAFAMRGDRQH